MATDNSTNALVRHLQNTAGSKSLSLRERTKALATRGENNILLLDTSGSMCEEINPHESKIDALWSIVQGLRAQNVQFKVCEFNTFPSWSDGVIQPIPTGGTGLDIALDFIASARPAQVTIVTDGEPNDKDSALLAASRLACKINVLYIGPSENTRAQDFCRMLASANNGSYAANELKTEQLALAASSTARLMLTTGEGNHKPTIQL
jgi:secreted protein with Ig-like and vWFA domain